ncbi:hypothetical protein [Dietzia sp.]|uniref:hypothetical protein n=1 Tax=Dietzia sp. TaxID=1871616 RepID=UPI002FD9FE9D
MRAMGLDLRAGAAARDGIYAGVTEPAEPPVLAEDSAIPEYPGPLEFVCPRTGIVVRISADSLPLGMRIPPEIFQLPLVHIETALVTALSGAATALHAELAGPDPDQGAEDEFPSGEYADGEGRDRFEEFEWLEEFDRFDELPEPAGPGRPGAGGNLVGPGDPMGTAEFAPCLDRLHSVADHLASAHHALVSGSFEAEAPGGTVRVTANTASAVTGVALRTDFAAERMDVAAAEIAATAAAAVGAANEERARIIGRALGDALLGSLGTPPQASRQAPSPGNRSRSTGAPAVPDS